MTRQMLESILGRAGCTSEDGRFVLPEGRTLTLYLARDGASLQVSKLCEVILRESVVEALDNGLYTRIAVRMLLLLLVVLALQIFSGTSGVLSFGHVAFMAIGAYTSALLTIPTGVKESTFLDMPDFLSSWIFPAELSALEATLAGAGFAALFALITAPPITRLAGVQAGIGTLAILSGISAFSTASNSGSIWWNWKTKPMRALRNATSS